MHICMYIYIYIYKRSTGAGLLCKLNVETEGALVIVAPKATQVEARDRAWADDCAFPLCDMPTPISSCRGPAGCAPESWTIANDTG